jgi:hypothetical protein
LYGTFWKIYNIYEKNLFITLELNQRNLLAIFGSQNIIWFILEQFQIYWKFHSFGKYITIIVDSIYKNFYKNEILYYFGHITIVAELTKYNKK